MKRGLRAAAWLLSGWAVLMVGCGGDQPQDAGRLHDTGDEILGDPEAVVAVIDGEEITLSEVNLVTGFWYSVRSPELQGVRSRKEAQQRALDNIIDQRLLSREARRLGIAVPDSAVDAMMASWESRFADDQERDERMAASNITLPEVRASFERDQLVQALVDQTVRDTIDVSAADVRAYYENHPEYFDTTQVKVRHILIMAPQDAPPESLETARALASDLLARVRAGEDFAELAREYSDDPGSAARGGELDFTRRGQWVPPFEQAAFALAPGETSDLVRTDYGYHIIQVMDRREGYLLFNDTLAERIEAVMLRDRVQPAVDALADQLRARSQVEVRI